MPINKVLLEHSLIHSFIYYKQVLLCCNGRVATETVWFSKLKILLLDPFQETLGAPWFHSLSQ